MASEKVPPAVLDWVNRGRAVVGLPPLNDLRKGDPQRSTSCPIANSLKDIAGYADIYHVSVAPESIWFVASKYRPTDELILIRPPRSVQKWIKQFDEGKWPDYQL